MACDKAHAQMLMKRLKTLPYYGDRDDFDGLRAEVGQMLTGEAADNEHATRIVDGLVRRLNRFPVPADVLTEAEATQQRTELPSPIELWGPPPPADCTLCNDLGWTAIPGGFAACTCAYGQSAEAQKVVAGLNAKFTPGGIAKTRKAMTPDEFAERTGA